MHGQHTHKHNEPILKAQVFFLLQKNIACKQDQAKKRQDYGGRWSFTSRWGRFWRGGRRRGGTGGAARAASWAFGVKRRMFVVQRRISPWLFPVWVRVVDAFVNRQYTESLLKFRKPLLGHGNCRVTVFVFLQTRKYLLLVWMQTVGCDIRRTRVMWPCSLSMLLSRCWIHPAKRLSISSGGTLPLAGVPYYILVSIVFGWIIKRVFQVPYSSHSSPGPSE